ncbi:pentatricopeptide repeat-containing protein At4g39952, mitochondrial-like [Nymphaea colorata]|nr:pentatricopeptide repeat-containing protein At4g39952, mitochondrial-like [Nymphaea colorata]
MHSPRTSTYQRIFSSLQQLRRCTTPTTPPSTGLFALLNTVHDLPSLLRAHCRIVATGHSSNAFLTAKLIAVYSDFNGTDVATKLFDGIPERDTFLWNSIIKAYFSSGLFEKALQYYYEMRLSGVSLDHFTFPMVVTSCAELCALQEAKILHGIAFRLGVMGNNLAICSSFMYSYAKCGTTYCTRHLFDEMSARDVVAWTVLIVGYVENGDDIMGLDCFRLMLSDGAKPNVRTVEGGLLACTNLEAVPSGKCLHGFLVKSGIGCLSSVQSSLLSMYSKCGTMEEAKYAFDELAEKDLFSWTAIVGSYSRNEYEAGCMQLFQEMQISGIRPDGIVISCLIVRCQSICQGMALHGLIIRLGVEGETLLCNSLVSMYCEFDNLEAAYQIFRKAPQQNHESWKCMIRGYVSKGLHLESMELFREMQYVGLKPDSDCLVVLLSACSQIEALSEGRCIHCYAIKRYMVEATRLGNMLVDMYSKCGDLNTAYQFFQMMDKDIVSWNIMISAYSGLGDSMYAINMFALMQFENLKPNLITFMSVFPACSEIAALDLGEWIHGLLKKMGFEFHEPLQTALIDMYAKCGKLKTARELFDLTPCKDVISWNVMISGYGMHGYAESAFLLLSEMWDLGIKPNSVTFLAILSACGHAGMISEGKYYFRLMESLSVLPTVKHYACMVDLLGRAGNLCEAFDLIQSMKCAPDGAVWGSLLGACKLHNNIDLAERVAEEILKLDPENDGYYVLMSNLYGSAGRIEEELQVREMMKNRRLRKRPGWSSVEVFGETTVFFVGDASHLQYVSISAVLKTLSEHMEDLDMLSRGSLSAS